MARIISFASGKGGVGKTTLCAGIGAALSRLGHDVVMVDCNMTTANLGLHLGIPLYPVSLNDVLDGKVSARDAIYRHDSGFGVMTASLGKTSIAKPDRLVEVFHKISRNTDFVLVDTAAGLGKEALNVIDASDEVLTITNPERPALIDAMKLGVAAERLSTRNTGFILNRFRNKAYEIGPAEAASFLNLPLLGVVEEDRNVSRALFAKKPVTLWSPSARASRQIMGVARAISGSPVRRDRKPTSRRGPKGAGFFTWLR